MNLSREVSVLVGGLIENKCIVHPVSVTQEIIDSHGEIYGTDADWYRYCAFERVRGLVREAIRRLKVQPREDPDPQLTFPGWKHLQRSYSVKRGGVEQGIPIEKLTLEEINAKCQMLKRMGDGCFEHADELERYRQERLQ